jgi:hypothetical protein
MNDCVCPGCGLRLPASNPEPAERCNATGECLEMCFALFCRTLVHEDPRFIHQHAVDAYAAQHAGGRSRPVTTAFALIGLCLAVEKGYTGRQVQLAHMQIGKKRQDWPRLEPPEHPGELTVIDVLQAGTDAEKEEMLMRWVASVWQSWEHRHQWVRETIKRVLPEEGR